MCEVVPGVMHERSLGVHARVHEVRRVRVPCHDHPPEAPTTLIILVVMCGVVPKGRNAKRLIREFYKENSRKLGRLLLVEHTRLAKEKSMALGNGEVL